MSAGGAAGRSIARLLLVALAAALPLLAALPAAAQQRPGAPPTPTRPRAIPSGADTIPLDSVAADSARFPTIDWVPADSVLDALRAREGYAVTRYQGARVQFDAGRRVLILRGDSAARAVVERGDSVTVIGDTIRFSDSTQVADVRGDTLFLRDPTQIVTARGRLVYDVRTRQGLVTNLCTTVANDAQTWFVCGERAAFVGDTTARGQARFFAHDSRFTSCEFDEPHYHFSAENVKVIKDRLLVGRPAVMYVEGVPVAWLPFFFQDLRQGRRSGFLAPRFGIAEFIRSGSNYRRNVENVGYYWAISDYLDAQAWLDWRSGARPTEGDPGWLRYNAELRYRWLSRFLEGRLGGTYLTQQDGRKMTQLSWAHSQQFSSRTNLNLNLNWTSSTQIVRNNALLPQVAVASILSQANFQTRRGPLSYSVGGSARQTAGSDATQVDFPSLNITSEPIQVGEWLTWTPRFSLSNNQTFNQRLTGPSAVQVFPGPPGAPALRDSIRGDTRTSNIVLATPVRLFGWDWQNTFTVTDAERDYPQVVQVVDTLSPTGFETRIFRRTYLTSVDWQTSFSLPTLSQGRWNFIPSVSLTNIESGFGFAVRSERTGDRFVTQGKRLVYGASVSPTFFRLYPGIGPFERFRHAIATTVNYGYSPSARVNEEFLLATGTNPRGYLGALPRSFVTLTVNTNIEAKRRARPTATPAAAVPDSLAVGADSLAAPGLPGGVLAAPVQPGGGPAGADKIRLLTVNFSSLSYDFIKADTVGNGLTDQTFNYTVRSDLLPGFDLQVGYDLFQGSVFSDTARFSPYRTAVRATLNFDRRSPVVQGVGRFFGLFPDIDQSAAAMDVGTPPTAPRDSGIVERVGARPIAGRSQRLPVQRLPQGEGWRLALTFSSTRQRPPGPGENVIVQDPTIECEALRFDPVAFGRCVEQVRLTPPDETSDVPGTFGRPRIVGNAVSNLGSALSFNLTPKWGAQWQTNYDFTRSEFASHVVSLQRELHDWWLNFSFTRAPTGAFSFSFFISLKAEPDLKFDYNRQSFRDGGF